ncbi:hypothetical protein BB559_001543 [Furculomyces boomerangus]|uniref:SEC7 domain-containing protein n=1 Tax=Furculomyces boomerangus TaxID=61424 RepID=A0A2T9Z1L6_9FUNG|nr:hypothetical protein BB559_001543 [Furculomyces boomerangus]
MNQYNGVVWKSSIEGEIEKVVVEMRKNVRWMNLMENEGIGALWIGSGRYPLCSTNKPTESQDKQKFENITEQSKVDSDQKTNITDGHIDSKEHDDSNFVDVEDEKLETKNSYFDQDIKDSYSFGKIGVSLGLTVFTLGEEYGEDERDNRSDRVAEELLSGFLILKTKIKALSETDSIPAKEILDPFLKLIKCGSATGPIARAALESIQRFVKLDLLNFNTKNGKEAITELSSAVTHCKFEATDTIMDESVLLQILEILRLVMFSPHSDLLSDTTVCEMLETVLSMACQMRLNDILRRTSELTLLELVGLVFGKLEKIENDILHNSNNSTGLEYSSDGSYGIVSVHELLRVLVMLTNPQNLQYTDTMRQLAIKALHVAIKTVGFSIANFEDLRALILNDLCHNLLLITGGNNIILITPALRILIEIFQTQGHLCKTQFEIFICQIFGRLVTPKTDIPPTSNSDNRKDSYPEQKPIATKLRRPSIVENSETPTEIPPDHTRRKSQSNISQNQKRKSEFADIDSKIVSFSLNEPINLTTPPTNTYEISVYNQCCMRAGVRGSVATGEIRKILLEGLHRILTLSPKLISSLWINYDCDMQRGNVFDFVISYLTMKAVPWPGTRHEIESEAYIDMTLYYIHHMAARNGVPKPDGIWGELLGLSEYEEAFIDFSNLNMDNLSESIHNQELPSIEVLLEKRKSKDMMIRAAELFNEKPAHGVSYLQKTGFIPIDNSTEMIMKLAQFLRSTPVLNKKLVGEYLSKPSNSEILQAYLELFDFKNKRLDEAVRALLGTFRLPGESQQIERIMKTFSSVYFATEPEQISSKNAAFVLSFAIIMLNTDLHNPQIKNRMKLEEFSRNLRGVNDSQDFSQKFLNDIYHTIQTREIVFPEEHEGETGFEYAWRELVSNEDGMVTNNTASLNDYKEIINNNSVSIRSNISNSSINVGTTQDQTTPQTYKASEKRSINIKSPWFSTGEIEKYDRCLFIAIWPRFLRTLTLSIVHCSNDRAFRLALSGMYSLLGLANKFGLSTCVDETLHYLAQISGLFESSFLADINSPVIVECSDPGASKTPISHPPIKANSDSMVLKDNLEEISDNLSILSTSVARDSDFASVPEPLSNFYKSDTFEHWEAYERKRIPLCNLSLQLGKDYCGQIALISLFAAVKQWPSSLGPSGWRTVIRITRVLINADLVSPYSKRVRNLITGTATIPRSDSLKCFLLARNKAIEISSGGSSITKQNQYQSGGGLFSALSSFLGGSPIYKSGSHQNDENSDTSSSILDEWYGQSYKLVPLSPSSDIVVDNMKHIHLSSLGTPYILRYYSESGYSEPFSKPIKHVQSPSLSQLRPLRLKAQSRWQEPLELLVQLVLSSRKCAEACEVSKVFSRISENDNNSFLTFLQSVATMINDSVHIPDMENISSMQQASGIQKVLSTPTTIIGSENRKVSKGVSGTEVESMIASESSPVISTGAKTLRRLSNPSSGKKRDSVSRKKSSGFVQIEGHPAVGDRVGYEPGLLYFIETISGFCEDTPNRIPLIWHVMERPFRRIMENADLMDLFVVERTVGVLMRVIIASLIYKTKLHSRMAMFVFEGPSASSDEIDSQDSYRHEEELSRQLNEVVERVFRCLGLLRDCDKTTFSRTEETLAAGLRVIAATDISALISAGSWPVVSSLLKSLSVMKEKYPHYPSREGMATFEIVLHLASCFRLDDEKYNIVFANSTLNLPDIIDLLNMFMPHERLFASISGGNNVLNNGSTPGREFAIKAARQQNAFIFTNRILAEFMRLQLHTRQKLLLYAISSNSCSSDLYNTPAITPSSSNPGFQMLSYWLCTLNAIANLCHSRHREIRSAGCLHLQRALNRSEWQKYLLSNHTNQIDENQEVAKKQNNKVEKNTLTTGNGSESSLGNTLPSYWIHSILQRVLLPLIGTLLRPDFLTDFSMEETHMRVLGIMTNFFLHNTTELLSINTSQQYPVDTPNSLNVDEFSLHQQENSSKSQPSFDVMWLRVVDVLVRYMRIGTIMKPQIQGPGKQARNMAMLPDEDNKLNLQNYQHPAMLSLFLAEISQEHLKNMILVLDSFKVFNVGEESNVSEQPPVELSKANTNEGDNIVLRDSETIGSSIIDIDKNRNSLWFKTWDIVGEVNQQLKLQWFSAPNKTPSVELALGESNELKQDIVEPELGTPENEEAKGEDNTPSSQTEPHIDSNSKDTDLNVLSISQGVPKNEEPKDISSDSEKFSNKLVDTKSNNKLNKDEVPEDSGVGLKEKKSSQGSRSGRGSVPKRKNLIIVPTD